MEKGLTLIKTMWFSNFFLIPSSGYYGQL